MIKYKIKYAEGSLADFNDGMQYYDKVSGELGDKFHAHFGRKLIKSKAHRFSIRKGIKV